MRIVQWFDEGIGDGDGDGIPDICHFLYTDKILWEKIYTEKRVNYDKRISRQNSVNRDLLGKADNIYV